MSNKVDPEKLLYALRLAIYRRNRRDWPLGGGADDSQIKNDFDNGIKHSFNDQGSMQYLGYVSESFQKSIREADDIIFNVVREYNNEQ